MTTSTTVFSLQGVNPSHEQPGPRACPQAGPAGTLAREHDACGVGFVARLDGAPSHHLVEDALTALGRMAHRGGASYGKETADGAGILIPLPRQLMRRVWQPLCGPLPDVYAVGHFFLPAEAELRAQVEGIIEETLAAHGLTATAWRDTPVRRSLLLGHAHASMPCIRQLLVLPKALSAPFLPKDFERLLYVARRHMEKRVRALGGSPDDFSVASLSSQSIIYKGMIAGAQLAAFYADLAAPDCGVHYAVFHERYSTNTQPAWRLVQPFHNLAHNGEINTLACNQASMRIREPLLGSPLFGPGIEHVTPVLDPDGSDSAMLGNALEFLLHGGRSLAHAAMMLMPEPFGSAFVMGEDKRAFYEYHAALMEPWDGPSALVFTDNTNQIGAMLDRNALRPCRYALTTDGLFILASEAGVLDIAPERIARRGRLQPRRMLLVDFAKRRIVTDAECKGRVISAKPYRHWVREKGIALRDLPLPSPVQPGVCPAASEQELLRQQYLYGFSREEVADILVPMGTHAQEPIASMGLDTPLAVLSRMPQLLFSYLKQRFAQVTNPAIDPLREGLVMTLTGFAGKRGNLLEETPGHYSVLRLANPVLFTEDLARLDASQHPHVRMARLPMLFPATGANGLASCGARLEQALAALCAAADAALDAPGHEATLLLLSDAGASPADAPIPSLLAVSAVHQHLIRQGRRHACSLLVDTGEAREPMHLAQLLAFGASAVHPRVAFAVLESLAVQGRLGENYTPHKARAAYATALQKGLLKTFSRMGISTLRSFMGGQGFEALGLGRNLVDRYFTGLPSRIGGIGLEEIAADALARHTVAYPRTATPCEAAPTESTNGECAATAARCEVAHAVPTNGECAVQPLSAPALQGSPRAGALFPELPDTGRHHQKKHGEKHLWSPAAIRALHKAVRTNDPAQYALYAATSDDQSIQPVTLRGLLQFAHTAPVPLEEVEQESALLRRFMGAAMSVGSISPEAHEAVAIAFNRVGGRSNCGEGGESAARLIPLPDGGSARSRVRQIASGRFGVTAAYLVQADEIQIKIAQGAKPGEGGQLPAHKVLPEIAKLRHTIPGVTLISPPPHHDIYSIEDLAQLVYDLKRLHPGVRVSVKLVAGTNIGTVATGVVKAGADSILVSGHDGGTGASPRTAMSFVGLPWELGLAEVQAALVESGLRSRVRLQVDGQLRTGRDIAVAALLGAEEFGFGANLLVALGCCMLRVCHLGTCPVGIAAQDPQLRKRFAGSPDHVERLLRFLAADLRGHMARLGMRTLDAMTGRADLLVPAPLPLAEPETLGSMAENQAELCRATVWQSKIAGLDLRSLCVRTRIEEAAAQGAEGCEKEPHASAVLVPSSPSAGVASGGAAAANSADSPLDQAMLEAVMPGVRAARPTRFAHSVCNTDRAACVRLSGEVARLYGEEGLTPGMVDITLSGSAGQSAGAFLMRGITLTIQGEANDYVGKGLSGGVIAVRAAERLCPPMHAGHTLAGEQAIIGNVALYGATSGEAYIAGAAGERFAVRNSGAEAVVEGVGDHACEYMTGGVVVVLGSTGYNFAAGMSGGVAFVLDSSELFQTRCNMDGVDIESVWQPDDVMLVRSLLTRHVRHTKSALAASVLADWDALLPLFLKVTPIEYRRALERMKRDESAQAERIAATEEVYTL